MSADVITACTTDQSDEITTHYQLTSETLKILRRMLEPCNDLQVWLAGYGRTETVSTRTLCEGPEPEDVDSWRIACSRCKALHALLKQEISNIKALPYVHAGIRKGLSILDQDMHMLSLWTNSIETQINKTGRVEFAAYGFGNAPVRDLRSLLTWFCDRLTVDDRTGVIELVPVLTRGVGSLVALPYGRYECRVSVYDTPSEAQDVLAGAETGEPLEIARSESTKSVYAAQRWLKKYAANAELRAKKNPVLEQETIEIAQAMSEAPRSTLSRKITARGRTVARCANCRVTKHMKATHNPEIWCCGVCGWEWRSGAEQEWEAAQKSVEEVAEAERR